MNRTTILYITAAIFFILALISFRAAKEAVSIQKQGELKTPEAVTTGLRHEQSKEPGTAATEQRPAFSPKEYPAQPIPAAGNRSAITIINPAAEENSESFSESIENISRKKDIESFSSQSGSASSERKSDIFSEEGDDAGDSAITKINRQPSESESAEMNERGIIMY